MTPRTDLVMSMPHPPDSSCPARSQACADCVNLSAVPGIHDLAASISKTWMAGHQGIYARLRRATPGHDDLPSIPGSSVLVNVAPHPLLGEVHQAGEDHEEDHHLEADALARLEMRLGRPHHESRHVLGLLVERVRCAVGVFDAA